jgi:hypothetical protein
VSETVSLARMIPIYRRDSHEITGAVRMDAAEMIGMEQMPGGRVQVMVRSGGGAQYYLTPVLANIFVGQEALEAYRTRLGGEEPMYPVPSFLPEDRSLKSATFVEESILDDLPELVSTDPREPVDPSVAAMFASLTGVLDQATLRPLTFSTPKSMRRARPRHARIPRHQARLHRYKSRSLGPNYALAS